MFVVTGANGFIGSSLVNKINEEDKKSKLICVDSVIPQEREEPLRGASYEKFVRSESLLKLLNDGEEKVDCIFHMGACTDTTEQNKDFLHINNTLYTKNLYLWCHSHGVPFIYASSAAIYGDGQEGFNDDKDPELYTALNPYGESKLIFDQWVLSQNHTSRWIGLRFFNVFGYCESHKKNMSSLVYKAFHQINQTNSLKLFKSHDSRYEDGMQMRDFVYIKDVVHWIWEIYKKPSMDQGIYNMGFGKARTWLDLATAVFKSMNKTLSIDWIDIPKDIRKQYQYFTKADMKKIQIQGISEPKWPLEKGVRDYIKNYLL